MLRSNADAPVETQSNLAVKPQAQVAMTRNVGRDGGHVGQGSVAQDGSEQAVNRRKSHCIGQDRRAGFVVAAPDLGVGPGFDQGENEPPRAGEGRASNRHPALDRKRGRHRVSSGKDARQQEQGRNGVTQR